MVEYGEPNGHPFEPTVGLSQRMVPSAYAGGCRLPVDTPHLSGHTDVALPQESRMAKSKLDLLQGTLDLLVLQALTSMGPQHGYGLARRIEQQSGNELLLNQGT